MKTMRLVRSLALVAAAASLLIAGCDEPFPEYREPQDVLLGEISFDAPDTVDVWIDPLTGGYFFQDLMTLRVTVTNVHDDLLEGDAHIDGRITVQSFAQIPRVLVVPLTIGTLRQPPLFQGRLALPPARSAEFTILWLPVALDGDYVFDDLPFTLIDGAKVYEPIAMRATVRVQLYELIQPMAFGNLPMRIVFRVREIPPG